MTKEEIKKNGFINTGINGIDQYEKCQNCQAPLEEIQESTDGGDIVLVYCPKCYGYKTMH